MDQRDIKNADSDSKDEAYRSNNTNKQINLVDTKFQTCDDEYSQDLFDDNETSAQNSPSINFGLSEITRINNSPVVNADITTTLTQTPKIGRNDCSPYHATVPSIPKSLIPFISTVNESWTSELETPQAKTAAEINLQRNETMERKGSDTIRSNGVIPDVTTPNGCFVSRVEDEGFSTSPILNTMTKRRRPKRRILKSLIDSKETTNEGNNKIGSLGSGKILPQNNTSTIQNRTFVIDEDSSLHNTNIHLIQDEMNNGEDRSMINEGRDSPPIESDGEECLMNERLRSCENLEDIGLNDMLKIEKGVQGSSECKDVMMIIDTPDVEYGENETNRKSVAELLKEMKELEENEEQITEYKYDDISMDFFTREAKALEIADMTLMNSQTQIKKPPDKSSVKRQWGLISFTQMCLLEQQNADNEDLGVKETEKADSSIESHEFSNDIQKNVPKTVESTDTSRKDAKNIKDIPSANFLERDEPLIDIDEFSPWFYDAKSDVPNDTNTADNLTKENPRYAGSGSPVEEKEMGAEDDKLVPSSFITSNKNMKNNAQLCVEETTISNHRGHNGEKLCTNSTLLHSSRGFSTASGKPIKISEDKIRKAEKLYNEIALQDEKHNDDETLYGKTGDLLMNNTENEVATPRNSYSSMGFSTASGKPIKISEDKLKAAEKLYDQIILQDGDPCDGKLLPKATGDHRTNIRENETTVPQNSYCSMGFSTASGNPIKISEDKLKAAEKLYDQVILQDGDLYDGKLLPKAPGEHRTNNRENETTVLQNSYGPMGFSTAGGKPIKISVDKLKAAEKLYDQIILQDGDPCDSKLLPKATGDHRTDNRENETTVPQNSYCSMGFSTASGNPIKISGDKLKAAEKLYDQIILQDGDHCDGELLPKVPGVHKTNNRETETTVPQNPYGLMGFTTAGGKPIKISEDKLKAAEQLYDETNLPENAHLPVDSLEVSPSRGIKRRREYDEDDASVEFGNKDCKNSSIVTEMVMKRAKTLYRSVDISGYQLPRSNNPTKELTNPVDIEKNEMSTRKHHETHKADTKSKFPSSFSTAISRHTEITESSMIKAKDTFNREDPCKFQRLPTTAREKIIAISDIDQSDQTALRNRSNGTLLDNPIDELRGIDNETNPTLETVTQKERSSRKRQFQDQTISTSISNPTTSISTGFSMANGKAIQISNQALSIARNLLDEEVSTNAQTLFPEEENGPKCRPSNHIGVGFSTRGVSVKAKRLFTAEQENTPPPNSLQRRSNPELETPPTSNISALNIESELRSVSENISSDVLQTSNRVRFSSDLQARKLFYETGDDTNEEMKSATKFDTENSKDRRTPLNTRNNYAHHLLRRERNKNVSSIQESTAGLYAGCEMFETNDRIVTPKLRAQRSWPLTKDSGTTTRIDGKKDGKISPYSDEITASTEALLADEENSFDGKSWATAITCSPTLIEDRNISVKPITLDANHADLLREAPPSPKFRSRKKNRRNKRNALKTDVASLKIIKDNGCNTNEGFEARFVSTSNSQHSSGVDTPTSNSSENSHGNLNPVMNTALVSKLDELKESPTKIQSGRTLSETEEREALDCISEGRLAATLAQEKQIRAKKKFRPKPIPGSLLLRRTKNKESRVSWRQVTNGVPPTARTSHELTSLGIRPDVMEVTAANALGYRFKCFDFYSKEEILANAHGVEIGDGGRLIFNENGWAGVAEFERAFMASPGIDPTLVPQRWIENHYRWIVWKLASVDRLKFGDLSMPRMLTPRNVMEQLKYRYDREIDKSERSALKRIIEKDDPPCQRMVLCVATITKIENPQGLENSLKMTPTSNWKVELTDGWYSIIATIDSAMAHLIAFGKVREGTKLVTCRAELLSDQGCSPLEIPGDVSLKIHTNSTRRSRWDAKLGYCRCAAPIATYLPAILPNGGLIGKLNTGIARVYPIQYFERTPSGQSVFRNNKSEDKAVMIYEEQRQKQIDAIYLQAQANFESRNRKGESSRDERNDGDPDSDQIRSSNKRPQDFDDTSKEAFQREVESMLRSSLPPPRKVTLVLKVRVMEGDNLAILTVWAPSEDIIDILKEGNRVSIHNIQTSGKRLGELQLTASHQSFVKPDESKVPSFPQRRLTPIPEIAVAGFNPPFGEFDTIGIVVSLGPAPHGMKNFEVVNLAYPNSDQSHSSYLSILFWEGIGAYGFSDILTIGATVACTNLQWRRGAPRIIPLAYSTEHSTFTRYPRQNYLRSAFESLKKQISDPVTYSSQCAAEISTEHQKKSSTISSPVVQGTPIKGSPCAATLQNKLAAGSSPRTPQNPMNSGEVTPAKYSIQRRLEKLQWYAEPPELSPISLNHSSMKVNHRFVSPVRTTEHIECRNQRSELSLKK